MQLAGVERRLAGAVSAERLEEYTLAVCRTPRLSGAPGERRAFRYLARTLRGWGYQIEEHRPLCWTSWPGAASLEILGRRTESIPCITHAMAVATPPGGVVLELQEVGRLPAGGAAADLAGRAALSDGLAMPATVHRLERAGAAAQIFVCGAHPHEMIASVVWGSPAPETAELLPRTPVLSVDRAGGERLRRALARGRVRVRLRARVDTAWRPLPQLIAHLRAPRGNGDFVLFSGHVDAWHLGAMDNGSANATQLEVARILAGRRRHLRRDLRLAFWSGHSHARYAGSAWYADNFWQELHEHCVLHLNVDSTGAKGATLLGEAIAMAETRGFASAIVERVAGQRLSGARPKRAGDQSFWGHGVPSLFMTLSEQPADDSETARAYAQLMGGVSRSGGLGWWWHTPEDTPDKLDPAHLVRDTQIYLLAARQLLESPVLPLDYRAVAAEATEILKSYAAAAKGRFDLGPAFDLLVRLGRRLEALHRRIRTPRLSPADADLINGCLLTLGRELIPIGYCRAERFEHDPTLPVPPFPGLEPMRRLGALPPTGDQARRLSVGLTRQRNKVCHHLHQALAMVEATLAVLARGAKSKPKRG